MPPLEPRVAPTPDPSAAQGPALAPGPCSSAPAGGPDERPRSAAWGVQGSPSPHALRPGGQSGRAFSVRRRVSQRRQQGGPRSCPRPHSRLHASQGQGQTAAWPRPTPGPFWETGRSLFLLSDNTTEAAAVTYLCCPRALPQRRLCALGLCGPRPHSLNLRLWWLEEGPPGGPGGPLAGPCLRESPSQKAPSAPGSCLLMEDLASAETFPTSPHEVLTSCSVARGSGGLSSPRQGQPLELQHPGSTGKHQSHPRTRCGGPGPGFRCTQRSPGSAPRLARGRSVPPPPPSWVQVNLLDNLSTEMRAWRSPG